MRKQVGIPWVRRANPLAGLNAKDRAEILVTLGWQEKQMLAQARRYYRQVSM